MPDKINTEKAKRNIEDILDKIHSQTDLALLREYRKIFKKEISLFSRRWAAAWLLMYYDQKEIPSEKTQKPLSKIDKKINKKDKTVSPIEILLPEDQSKKLFISIGKNRRLFPREIITLIMAKTPAARDDIGLIRILDNYSFVQVRDTKADEIIEAINGLKFRGRTLSVNYAKPKSSENESE